MQSGPQFFHPGEGLCIFQAWNFSMVVHFLDVTAYRASNDFDWLIVTNAPSLVYFKYFCFVNMESLERADITIFHLKDVDCDRSATLLRESAMYRFYICPFMIMMHSSSGCILIRGLPFTILLNWNLRIIVTIAS
ncbi:hypothetical protein V6N12_001078 [Hibiscus sabdariffa]|uniref:Uncharacterized protein n=1 Tax=Hibiscus sabdariffa TaxID=183260 RepID=A0ABR2C669_9ROSI